MTSDKRLMQRVAVSGASGKTGWRVVVVGRDEPRGEQAVQRIQSESGNSDVEFVCGDLSSVAGIDALGEVLLELAPVLDVLINNAGISGPARPQQTLAEMDYDGWAEAFAVNSMGPLRVLQGLREKLAEAPAGNSEVAIAARNSPVCGPVSSNCTCT